MTRIRLSVARFGCLLLLSAALAGTGGAAGRGEAPGTPIIAAAAMRDYLTFIASDEMEGRATPSRGLDTAAKFIATLLARWGVKPGGDSGTYFQKIAMSARHAVPAGATAVVNGQSLAYGDQYLTRTASGSGTAHGSLVYAGSGWMVKSRDIDAFRGLDVKGKVVVVLNGGRGPGALDGKQGEDWADPPTYARMRGAAGLVYIANPRTNWAAIRRGNEQTRFSVDRFAQPGPPPDSELPQIVLSASASASLMAGEPKSVDELFNSPADPKFTGFDLKADKSITFTTSVETLTATTQNVVGIVEGGDRNLKSEYVGLSAHLDHLGTTETPVNGDRVYNGADDDGSGTVAVLNTAEAFSHARTRPKRSMIFIWHIGEERGLWGSRYFTMYPEVPLKQITALINIDMIGRSRHDGDTSAANSSLTGPNSIYVIGSTMMSSELDALTRRVNEHYLKLAYDFRYDDPKDTNRYFFRSDHVNYARQGIPILFFFDGVHEDYHRLSDEVSKIDFDKMERVTRTIYQTLWELGNLRERPKVDKPKPPQLQ